MIFMLKIINQIPGKLGSGSVCEHNVYDHLVPNVEKNWCHHSPTLQERESKRIIVCIMFATSQRQLKFSVLNTG